jgi:hypothetical protein
MATPTLTDRVLRAINKGRDHAQVAGMIAPVGGGGGQDLDMPVLDIQTLRAQLQCEIEARQRLCRALDGVLHRRGPHHRDH